MVIAFIHSDLIKIIKSVKENDMKLWKWIITISLLIFSFNTNAALIDNDSYTTDNVSGLDWLDLSVTDAQSYNSALSLNPGWRLATHNEISNLYSILFDGIYDTSGGYGVSSTVSGAAYSDQSLDVSRAFELFGLTNNTAVISSQGYYEHNDGTLRMGGVSQLSTTGDTYVYFDYTSNEDDFREIGHSQVGVYMVRTSVVPLPSTVWLLGSGLIGLVSIARRKKS